jgi:hypothetical protein
MVPDDLLTEAEKKWAPADDPVFELVPPPFQEIVDKCYDDLGRPAVTFESFWEVYCDLRDKVDATIPLDVAASLNQSIFSEPEGGEDVQFALANLKSPELDMRNAVDADEGEDEEGLFHVSFTTEDNQDQLY